MSETFWWWLRHAKVAGEAKALHGRGDIAADLSDTTPLARLAGLLPRETVFITSPLKRAQQTAQALMVLCPARAALESEDSFAEQDFGLWQGLTHEVIAARYKTEAEKFWQDPCGHAPPQGESFSALCTRVQQAIGRLGERNAGRHILAVAHAGPIRAALALALDVAPQKALSFALEPLSLTRLVHTGKGGWRVEVVNHRL